MKYALIAIVLFAIQARAEKPMPASSQFAVDLYHQLDNRLGNVFFSPLSIRAALAMTAAGAKGKTLEEMNAVLHLGGDNAHAAMSELLRDLEQEPKLNERPKLTLRIANALWGQQRYPFNPAYVKLVRQQYQAEAKSLDFGDEPAARKQINDWVEQKTNKKITNLIPSGILNNETRLVLTNAVYFNARWAHEFGKEDTSAQPFHVSKDNDVTVPTMRQTTHFNYAETPEFQAIGMRYEGYETSMVILLPRQLFNSIESNLTAKQLDDTIGALKSRKLDLSLPRFEIEQSASLADKLQALGIKLAFDAILSDFSGMTSAQPLFISDVLHKAFVRVDEEGTEAAAATAVMMGAGAAPMMDEPLRVQVDRPFLFVIRHEKTGEILFMGRVVNPKV
jgi:serpin B